MENYKKKNYNIFNDLLLMRFWHSIILCCQCKRCSEVVQTRPNPISKLFPLSTGCSAMINFSVHRTPASKNIIS